jgi:hypothetical protein
MDEIALEGDNFFFWEGIQKEKYLIEVTKLNEDCFKMRCVMRWIKL